MPEHVEIALGNGTIVKAVVLGRLDESLIFVWGGCDWNFLHAGAEPGDIVVLEDGEDLPGAISEKFVL